MPKYFLQNANELREAVYNSNIHDANIVSLDFNPTLMCVTIIARNVVFRKEIHFYFPEIKSLFSQKGNWEGCSNQILSLTIEDNFSLNNAPISMPDGGYSSALLFIFELFSGSEIWIISECVDFEVDNL